MGTHYHREKLPRRYEEAPPCYQGAIDDGTMSYNRERLEELLVGRRIVTAVLGKVKADNRFPGTAWWGEEEFEGLILTLDNGYRVVLADSHDCCAYTELEAFLVHPERVDHIITGVGTTDSFHTWHIYADMGDVLEMKVGWSPGNPYYYGYGFDIHVLPVNY